MSESLDIDSPFRGLAMPKSYSGDLRERVIEAVTMEGVSRREAAERFDISASSAIRWVQRWDESGSAAPSHVAEVSLRWNRMRSGYCPWSPNGRT
jgi:transposase-like protein